MSISSRAKTMLRGCRLGPFESFGSFESSGSFKQFESFDTFEPFGSFEPFTCFEWFGYIRWGTILAYFISWWHFTLSLQFPGLHNHMFITICLHNMKILLCTIYLWSIRVRKREHRPLFYSLMFVAAAVASKKGIRRLRFRFCDFFA